MKKDKVVYTVLCADPYHYGHRNILKKSMKLGKLIVGVMSDEAIASYKRIPMQPFEKRKAIMEDIKGIWKVVPQETLDYRPNLRKYKPDIVTNGDDWKTGVQKETRQQVIDTLKEWDGKVIDFPYTPDISSTLLIEDFRKNGITPDQRRLMLRRMINIKPVVRVIEAHNGLSALVAENTKVRGKEYDAIWESSLTDSVSKGKPDIELVDFTSRVQTIEQILEVTTKPLIVDGDTGGQVEHFKYIVRTLERLGVSAIIIEDKRFPKINSLMPGAKHIQEDIPKFCEKIREGKKARITEDFMIFARIESLIADKPVEDAIERAKAYIKAGADAIMIHSKDTMPDKILEFCGQYKELENKVPLVAVPTTYNIITEKELVENGVSIIIHANHQIRAAYQAMKQVAEMILVYGNSKPVDNWCCSVNELFELTNR